MKISAIVCTHNRMEAARRCVAALREQTLPAADYEVLVVDNASTDGTVERLRAEFPDLHVIEESRLGLSRARNTGLRAARGAIVAFTDDDAIPEPNWLAALVQAFDKVTPTPGIVGGIIKPIWETPRPKWLPDEVVAFLTILDLGPEAGPVFDGQKIVGCNMAAPRALCIAAGGFPEELGRRGPNLLSMEDAAIFLAITNAGHPAWYEPAAVVKHWIPASRLSKRWMLRRNYWEGISRGLIQTAKAGLLDRLQLLLRPLAGLVVYPGDWLAVVHDGDRPERFLGACRTVRRIGYLLGLLGLVK